MYSSAAVKEWFSTRQSVDSVSRVFRWIFTTRGGTLSLGQWENGFGQKVPFPQPIRNKFGTQMGGTKARRTWIFREIKIVPWTPKKITFRKENFEHFVLQNGRSYFHEIFRICRRLGHRTKIINLGVSPLIWAWRGANFSIGADVDSSFIFSMKWFFVVFAERWMTSAYRFFRSINFNAGMLSVFCRATGPVLEYSINTGSI